MLHSGQNLPIQLWSIGAIASTTCAIVRHQKTRDMGRAIVLWDGEGDRSSTIPFEDIGKPHSSNNQATPAAF
jgi:hypothetical protein